VLLLCLISSDQELEGPTRSIKIQSTLIFRSSIYILLCYFKFILRFGRISNVSSVLIMKVYQMFVDKRIILTEILGGNITLKN